MPAKITQEIAEKRVQEKCKELNYTYSSFEYIGAVKTYLHLKCHCGNEWNSTCYTQFVNSGKGCPKCGGSEKITQEEAELRVHNKCKEMNYTCSSFEYIGSNCTYLTLKCHCGNEWNSTSYSSFINNGNGCPKCGLQTLPDKFLLTQKSAELRVQEKCKEMNYTYSSFEYIGSKCTYLTLKCHCGNEWNSTNYANFINNGRGCPKCGSGEANCIVMDIDPILGDDFYIEKRFDDCRDKNPLPFDRFVPYLNMLLEYDGSQHFEFIEFWHKSEDQLGESKKRDKIKTEYAINNGYNFIRIAYYEDHVQTLESFLALVLKHPDKQIVQLHGEVQILDKN